MATQDDRDEIARRAYGRYEARGRADGEDQNDWFEAERELRGGTQTARASASETGATDQEAGTGGFEPLDEQTARRSGTGPTSSPTGTGPEGNVRTPGTHVSGGPTERAR